MSGVATTKMEEGAMSVMKDMCSDLFREWLADLNLEEKTIWLWNAMVEMRRIKERRPLAC